ncbi:uncharacterized protein isoform X2 [Musca autumnalis]|uniref:uncharacterized protein isoform X2 n=1 Tax=Musca autumnalis TaxID=221902 RepID=UPI003CF87943
MATVKFRHLIDMAIGSPEPGHVNFYALHCLLSCIAEKLNLLDDPIVYSKYETLIICSPSAKASNDLKKIFSCGVRTEGGSDPNDPNEHDSKSKESVAEADPPPIDLTVEQEEAQDGHVVTDIDAEAQITQPTGTENVNENAEVIQSNNSETPSIISNKNVEEIGTNVETNDQFIQHSTNSEISKWEILENRLGRFDNLIDGVMIMKNQLLLAIEQQLLLTFLTLTKKPDTHKVRQLLETTQALRIARKQNINIDSTQQVDTPETQSLEWRLSELELGEGATEQDILEVQSSCTRGSEPSTKSNHPSQHDLEGCLCYSPGKILDQLLELKGDFCILTNNVNEVTARLVQQERQQTFVLIQELQEHMRDVKLNINNIKEELERADIRLKNNTLNIENVKRSIDSLIEEKVNKAELEIMLADKVDYNQLQRKVSLDQLLEVQCRIDKRFCEAFKQIKDNDKKLEDTAETLRQTLGFASIEGVLLNFKQTIESEILALREMLQKYMDSTNDDCAAAGGRVKVLQDLACLSCDTTCVMRTMEKTKVAKLPNAHASQSLSPVITYELGAIRKNGFTQARHAGGPHTTSTARERVEKVLLSGK